MGFVCEDPAVSVFSVARPDPPSVILSSSHSLFADISFLSLSLSLSLVSVRFEEEDSPLSLSLSSF